MKVRVCRPVSDRDGRIVNFNPTVITVYRLSVLSVIISLVTDLSESRSL
jgi:hypothetical protein